MKATSSNIVLLFFIILSAVALLVRCERTSSIESVLGKMNIPDENPQSAEKIELGRKLFFDKRLSSDQTVSCATCHVPSYAFTDQLQFSEGVNQHHAMRNSPSLLNSGYLQTIMFDAEITTLEMQALVPIKDTNEMGMLMSDLIVRLANISEYQATSRKLFGRGMDAFVITRALASFQRSLISDNAPFDQAERGELLRSEGEERGWKLFSDQLYCTKCHPAPHFTTFSAENNGTYAKGDLDMGRFRIDSDSSEIGFFKIPSLRNIELTAPYMHNGSLKSLGDVLDHYQKGGANNVNQNDIIQPFKLSRRDRGDLLSFLKTLTDTTYMDRFR